MSTELSSLFDKVTVMHSTDRWSDVHRDLVDVLGPPTFTDNQTWASFIPISLSDETGPSWSLLARTSDLEEVARIAGESGWSVGTPTTGSHETRLVLTSPAGLTTIAYTPIGQR